MAEMTDGDGSPPTRWVLAPRVGEAEQVELGVDSLLLAQLLWNRGVRAACEAEDFLSPGASALGDPATMRGVPEATGRLLRALSGAEQIAVYGDYDVDGVAGAALLVETVQGLGGQVVAHLPHRARDGYGVNPDAVRRLAADGARVMITVDCGITANRELELARELGMDAIVTDHHAVPPVLPAALAVVNPHQDGCCYPFKELAGGGVAFQLARSVLLAALDGAEARRRWERLTPLAALSTVADVVPLLGENRSIVARGLAASRSGAVPGLEALCDGAGRSLGRLTARDLAFSVIPRLNAAGRMGDARDALDLLLAPDPSSAQTLAARLESANGERRTRTADLLLDSEADAERMAREGAIVLAGDYPVGLAGLIAARLADRFAVPCVVIERREDISRGSARGSDGFPVLEVLGEASAHLIQFGGHPRAAGFTMKTDEIEAFRASFQAVARALRGAARPERTVLADAQIRLGSVGHRLAVLTDRFEPTGAGNPPPTFISRGVTVRGVEPRPGGHLQLRLGQGGAVRRAIAFSPAFPAPEPGARLDILYEVQRTAWNDAESVDMIIRDVRPTVGSGTEAASV